MNSFDCTRLSKSGSFSQNRLRLLASISGLLVPDPPLLTPLHQVPCLDQLLQVDFDRVAIGPGHGDRSAHRQPPVFTHDADQLLGERSEGRHEPLLLDLSSEDLFLPKEATDEEADPVEKLRLIAVEGRLGTSQCPVVLVLRIFHDPLERAERHVPIPHAE